MTLLTACAGPQTMAPQGNNTQIIAEQNKQRNLAYETYINSQTKLQNIAFPLFTNNTQFCGNTLRPATGISAWNIDTVASQYQTAAKNLYGLGPDLVIQSIVPKSPAEQAGLKSGDLILSIDGRPVPRGAKAFETAQSFINNAGYRQIEIAYIRNGVKQTGLLKPVRACDYPVILDNSGQVNAYADGQKIVVTRGIMRFANNDDEIALVVAHELAHNTMGHIEKLKQNVMVGSLGGLAVDALLGAAGVNTGNQFSQMGGNLGQQRYSVPFEQEADYVGMYYMARAGYKTENVANFWRRMAAEGQASIDMRSSHPASAERFIAIDQTHQEIIRKKHNNQSLTPNSL